MLHYIKNANELINSITYKNNLTLSQVSKGRMSNRPLFDLQSYPIGQCSDTCTSCMMKCVL